MSDRKRYMGEQTPGVQPVDYHRFGEEQWDKAMRRGERLANVVLCFGVLMIAVAAGVIGWVIFS